MSEVLIVGAGGGGMAAAIEAHDAGAKVQIVEAAEKPGGSTAMSAGVIYAADTDVQREAGIEGDSVEDQIDHYMAVTQFLLEPRLVRALLEGTHEVIPWLQAMGVVFPPEGLHAGGADSTKRSHLPAPTETDLGPAGGAAIAAALLHEVEAREIPIRLNTRVADLITEDSAVVGARLEDGEEIRTDAVILTTGGIGHNRELLAKHFPTAASHPEEISFYIGAPTVRGDGLELGEGVGAELVGHDTGLCLPTPGFEKVVDGFFASWLVFVNEQGQRFIDEAASYSVLPDAVQEQPGARCWAIMDHEAFSGAGDDPSLSDPYGYGVEIAGNWRSATLAEQLEKGRVKKGETLEELAERVGIDPGGLRATVDRYNADVAEGRDTVFEKSPPYVAVDQAPFYAVELRSATLGMTFTGLRIDEHAHVLTEAGTPIPGLYAAGETTGGIQGIRYVASGCGVGNALAFGRRAGRAVARDRSAVASG
jgi:succinate dehydrogenase/fumarate reductase flavoprotein subunit